jgi:hypothetical protein
MEKRDVYILSGLLEVLRFGRLELLRSRRWLKLINGASWYNGGSELWNVF